MKHLKIAALVMSFFGLLALPSHAEYTINVCTIELHKVVADQILKTALKGEQLNKLVHVFVQGNGEGDTTGLNYEPENQQVGPAEILGGTRARIGKQNHQGATCWNLYRTEKLAEYQETWRALEESYQEYANKYDYKLVGSNCQTATEAVLKEQEYEIPADFEELLGAQRAIEKNVKDILTAVDFNALNNLFGGFSKMKLGNFRF